MPWNYGTTKGSKRDPNLPGEQNEQVPWVKEVHQDIEKCGIREEYIGNREVFRRKLVEVNNVQRRTKRVVLEE